MATQTTSFTLAGLIDRVQGDLGARGSNLITTADVTAWAKEISRVAAQQTQWYQKSDSVDATDDVADYDLPTDCIALLYIAHNDLPLSQTTLDELEARDPYWRDTPSGVPLAWYRRGATGYTLYPTPDTTIVNGIDRIYKAIPAMPDEATDTFDFPQANEMLLVEYCLFRGALKMTPGEGEQKVAIYERRYLQELQRLKQTVQNLGGLENVVAGRRQTLQHRGPFDISYRTIPAP